MSVNPSEPASPAPDPEQANEAIRAFLQARLGRFLRPDETQEYERLLQQWATAQAEVTQACATVSE